MKGTFAFCLQLPEEEFPTAFLLMQSYLKQKHPKTSVRFSPLKGGHMETYREIRVVGSRNSISAFKKWMIEFPHVENAFSHYIVANPHRKVHEPIEISAKV